MQHQAAESEREIVSLKVLSTAAIAGAVLADLLAESSAGVLARSAAQVAVCILVWKCRTPQLFPYMALFEAILAAGSAGYALASLPLWLLGSGSFSGQLPGSISRSLVTLAAMVVVVCGAFYFLLSSWIIPAATYVLCSLAMAVALKICVKISGSGVKIEGLKAEIESMAAQVERTRLARELHDSLGHSLTAMNIQLDLASRAYKAGELSMATGAIARVRNLNERALVDLRHAIKASGELNANLKEAVESLVMEYRREGKIAVNLIAEFEAVPRGAGHELFSIVKECLHNCTKYSNAASVSVTIRQEGDELVVEVRDNGVGLPERSSDGFGIQGMKERAAKMKGNLTLVSEKTGGTTVRLSVPNKRSNRAENRG